MPEAHALRSVDTRWCDERFNRDQGWTTYPRAPGFEQRYLHENHLMYCETLTRVECSRAAAVREISGPWTWWEHGNISQFRLLEDGSSQQTLSPVGWYPTRIILRIYPPIPIQDEDGLRLPIRMSRHFKGWASMDVLACPEPGWQTIRGRFHGVENHIPLIPLMFASRIHLRAESGAYMPRGTGWCGLKKRLTGSGSSGPRIVRKP